jgi:hypothetical protein
LRQIQTVCITGIRLLPLRQCPQYQILAQVVSTPASYLGAPGFKSWPWTQLS